MLCVFARCLSHHDVVLQQLSRLEQKAKPVRPGRADLAVMDTDRHHCSVSRPGKRPCVMEAGVLLDGRRVDGLESLVDPQKQLTL